MTANNMMPTHGKRPEGLNDDDWIYVQFRDGTRAVNQVRYVAWWDHKDKHYADIMAYAPVIFPEPYIPAPDYSKCIGKVCKFWDDYQVAFGILISYNETAHEPFTAKFLNGVSQNFQNCRPVTADEIVKE